MSEETIQLIDYLQSFANDDTKEITKYCLEMSQNNTKLLLNYIEQLQQENKELKRRLNWIVFGEDSELALRYLRKIGYVDFDDERKCYINKHNNEPFFLDEEEEKKYYLKDEELDEYTQQLEQKNKELKEQIKLFKKDLAKAENTCQKYHSRYCDIKLILTEFEKWLDEKIKCTEQYADNDMAKGYINAMALCKYYLQELKEGKK